MTGTQQAFHVQREADNGNARRVYRCRTTGLPSSPVRCPLLFTFVLKPPVTLSIHNAPLSNFCKSNGIISIGKTTSSLVFVFIAMAANLKTSFKFKNYFKKGRYGEDPLNYLRLYLQSTDHYDVALLYPYSGPGASCSVLLWYAQAFIIWLLFFHSQHGF